MQLTYRGAHYNYAPNPIPKLGPVLATGTYRGAPVSFQALADMPEQPRFTLKWRGVSYRSGLKVHRMQPTEPAVIPEMTIVPEAKSLESAPATPKLSVLERARALFIRRHQRIRQREQSMLARLDEEVGLTAADAANYESQIQGKVPHDFAGYDRSDTAMS